MKKLFGRSTSTRAAVAVVIVATVLGSGSVLVDDISEIIRIDGPVGVWVAYLAVVGTISFLLVVFGDLLPTEVASRHAELVARFLAPLASLILLLLSPCGRAAHCIVGFLLRPVAPEQVSDQDVEEEIRDLVDEGRRAGVIERTEKDIINRVFKLDDKALATLMTPRTDVAFLDQGADVSALLLLAAQSKHTWFPVRGSSEDDVIGILSIHDLIVLRDQPERFPHGMNDLMTAPLEVPASINALKLLELFRESGKRFAIVRDEYGGLAGIITVYDVLHVMAGDMEDLTLHEERRIVEREDGSYLVDAGSDVRELFDTLGIADESPFNGAEFHSLGGFIMTTLGYVPVEGERFEALGFSFEVVDMDNKRIDKVLVSCNAQRRVAGS